MRSVSFHYHIWLVCLSTIASLVFSHSAMASNPTIVPINGYVKYQDCWLQTTGGYECSLAVTAVTPAWILNSTVESFDNYFEVHVCPAANTWSTSEAIQRYVEVNLPFVEIVEDPANCLYYAAGDVSWSHTFGPQGEYIPDPINNIFVVYGRNDSRYSKLVSGSTVKPATLVHHPVQLRDEHGFIIDQQVTWDLIINLPDFTFLDDFPSLYPDWDKDTVGLFQYDTVLHELLHVLGMAHDMMGDPIADNKHSISRIHTMGGGHLATEAFGDPYNPDGPSHGIRTLPIEDGCGSSDVKAHAASLSSTNSLVV